MGSRLDPTLANSLLCYHEKRWLDKCQEEFKPPVFYRRYVDDIFVLFRKEEHLKLFLNYLICATKILNLLLKKTVATNYIF